MRGINEQKIIPSVKMSGIKRLCITAKGTKVDVTYGNHNSKDTMVIINNVTVSFLCLLAAPWKGERVPHQKFKAMEV